MMLKYKGYSGKVEFDEEARIFHGEVIDTQDVITFQGNSVDEIEQSFKDSIDDYLAFCAERGEEPERPFSGKLLLRIPSDLHHEIFIKAQQDGKSINSWVVDILKKAS
jgi:predicted HicB family RNase H-like nuclease